MLCCLETDNLAPGSKANSEVWVWHKGHGEGRECCGAPCRRGTHTLWEQRARDVQQGMNEWRCPHGLRSLHTPAPCSNCVPTTRPHIPQHDDTEASRLLLSCQSRAERTTRCATCGGTVSHPSKERQPQITAATFRKHDFLIGSGSREPSHRQRHAPGYAPR